LQKLTFSVDIVIDSNEPLIMLLFSLITDTPYIQAF
jgi:hypothetical protein